jgi:hypothetical protein
VGGHSERFFSPWAFPGLSSIRIGQRQAIDPDGAELVAQRPHSGVAAFPSEDKGDLEAPQGQKAGPALQFLGDHTLDVYLNDVAYWSNVPLRVWEYTIGGYQVIKKWLSYREKKLLGQISPKMRCATSRKWPAASVPSFCLSLCWTRTTAA